MKLVPLLVSVAGPRRASLADKRTECFGFLFGARWPVLRLVGPSCCRRGAVSCTVRDCRGSEWNRACVVLLSELLLAPSAWRLGSVGEREVQPCCSPFGPRPALSGPGALVGDAVGGSVPCLETASQVLDS